VQLSANWQQAETEKYALKYHPANTSIAPAFLDSARQPGLA